MPNHKKKVTESHTSARNAALFGILTALALVLGYVERPGLSWGWLIL